MSTTIADVADALGLVVSAEDDHEYISLPHSRFVEDYITLTHVDEMDVEDRSLVGERWVGSWSIGPRADVDLLDVLAWVERTIRR